MSKKELKKISVEVTNECWKKLKIASVQKETTLQQLVKEILEKNASKRPETIIEENV